MNEEALLVLFVAVLYASECVGAFRSRAHVFHVRALGAWRTSHEFLGFSTLDQVLHVADPRPGAGGLAAAEGATPAMDTAGVCRCSRDGARPPRAFEAFGDLRADGADVREGGAVLLRAHTDAGAKRFAAVLESLRRSEPETREAVLDRLVADLLDVREARRQIRRRHAAARAVNATAVPTAFALFAATPLLFHLGSGLGGAFGLLATWSLAVLTAVRARAARRRWRHDPGLGTWQQAVTFALAPPAAIRAPDLATRDMLGAFHALAVMRAACPGADARRAAAAELRRLAHPNAHERTPCCAAEAGRRARWERHLRAWIVREWGDDALAPGAPRRADGMLGWCPRCLAQYTRTSGECADCEGVVLQPLP